MAATFEIDTYWNVATLVDMLNAVAGVMAASDYASALRFAAFAALAMAMFAWFGAKHLEIARWILQIVIVVPLLMLPVAQVLVRDRTNLEPPQTVANVPIGLAFAAFLSNQLGSFFARKYESAFSLPDSIALSRGDVAFGHRMLRLANQATVRDPGLRADLTQFVKECLAYDIRDGSKNIDAMLGANDAWTAVLANGNPARFVTLRALNGPGTTVTCLQAGDELRPRVLTEASTSLDLLGKKLMIRAPNEAIARAMATQATVDAYSFIAGVSVTAESALRQGMFNTFWSEMGTELPAILSDPARVAEANALMAATSAARAQNSALNATGILAQDAMPAIRNVIEAVIVALFPIVVVFTILSSPDAALRSFLWYLRAFAWIALWPVLFAIINHFSLKLAAAKFAKLGLTGAIPAYFGDYASATLIDQQAIVGYLLATVPLIAAQLVRMSEGAAAAAFAGTFSGYQSSAGSIGAQYAQGNITMGTLSTGVHSQNLTSANRLSSAMDADFGGQRVRRADGGFDSLAPDGTYARQAFRSSGPASITLDQVLSRSSASASGSQQGQGSQRSVQRAQTEAIGSASEQRRSNAQGTSSSTSQTTSSGTQSGEGERYDNSFSHGQSGSSAWSQASQSSTRLGVGLPRFGGGAGRGGGGLKGLAGSLLGALDASVGNTDSLGTTQSGQTNAASQESTARSLDSRRYAGQSSASTNASSTTRSTEQSTSNSQRADRSLTEAEQASSDERRFQETRAQVEQREGLARTQNLLDNPEFVGRVADRFRDRGMTASRLYGMAYRPEQYNEVVDMFRQYLEERMPASPARGESPDETNHLNKWPSVHAAPLRDKMHSPVRPPSHSVEPKAAQASPRKRQSPDSAGANDDALERAAKSVRTESIEQLSRTRSGIRPPVQP